MVEEEKGMKKFLPTIILVILLAAGFAYAKGQNFFKEKPADQGKTLFSIKKEDVSGLRITGGSGAVELKKVESGWQMVKPVAYLVSAVSADSLVGSLPSLTYKDKITDNPSDLAAFGLNKPNREIEAVLKDGTGKKLQVGNPLPIPGSSYVKFADEPAVYEVDDKVLGSIQDDPLVYVEKSVFSLAYDKVKSVAVEWKGDKWELVKKDLSKKAYESPWTIGGKELKPEEGSGILDKLAFLSAEDLPTAKSDTQWNAPELKVTVKEDDSGKETEKTYIGKLEKDKIRIAKDDGQWAYTAGADQIQGIFDQGKK